MILAGLENVDAGFLRDFAIVVVALLGAALTVKKLFFEPKLSDKYATVSALLKLETATAAQITEMRAYVHQTMHEIRNTLQAQSNEATAAREGIHDRLNVIVEVLYRMRGQLDGPPSGRGQK